MITLGINPEAVKLMSKQEFIDSMSHHAPHCDLGAEYDKIVNPAEEKPVKKAAPKKVKKVAK